MGEFTNFLNSFKRDIQSPIGINDDNINVDKCYSSEYYENSYITNLDIDNIIGVKKSSIVIDINGNNHEIINKNDICIINREHGVNENINYGNGHYYISNESSAERINESEIDKLMNT